MPHEVITTMQRAHRADADILETVRKILGDHLPNGTDPNIVVDACVRARQRELYTGIHVFQEPKTYPRCVCGEPYPCTVARNPGQYRGDIVSMHYVVPEARP